MRQEQEMSMVRSILRTFANTIADIADALEPQRIANKWPPTKEDTIEDLKEAVKNAIFEDQVDREARQWDYPSQKAREDEFAVPEMKCKEVDQASLDEFRDIIGEVRKDPEFKLYKRPAVDDLENALQGIRRAQEVLDHLKFGITKRRPDFAIDLEADGVEAEKCRLMNRLEELANNPTLLTKLNEDPEFPTALIAAAEDLVILKKDYKDGIIKHWDITPKVEAMVDSLFRDGIRVPTVKSGWVELYEKTRQRQPPAKPLGIRTKDYDTTRKYTVGDTIYLKMLDDRTQLTNEDVGPLIGEVTGVPTEQDPMLRVDIAGEIEQ